MYIQSIVKDRIKTKRNSNYIKNIIYNTNFIVNSLKIKSYTKIIFFA